MEGRRFAVAGGMALLAGIGALAAGCGGSASSPNPTPTVETWFVVPVLCSSCPGLTDVQVDRSTVPSRARLPLGARTSVRATAKVGCGGDSSGSLAITRWEASDPAVIRVEPASDDSAIVSALAVGTSRLTAERRLPGESASLGGLRDSFRADPPCPAQPELLLEVVR